jgi:hypothetical protein
MAAIGITGMGLTGVVRMNWVQDDLAHVLEHSHTDETSGTWTGRACPEYRLALGSDVDSTTLRRLAGEGAMADLTWEAPDDMAAEHGQVFQAAIAAYQAAEPERAEELWEKVRAIWSRAWSANYAALEFLQDTGLSSFSPVKPQRWLAASFEHHTSPHGLDPISTTSSSPPKRGCRHRTGYAVRALAWQAFSAQSFGDYSETLTLSLPQISPSRTRVSRRHVYGYCSGTFLSSA